MKELSSSGIDEVPLSGCERDKQGYPHIRNCVLPLSGGSDDLSGLCRNNTRGNLSNSTEGRLNSRCITDQFPLVGCLAFQEDWRI